MSPTGGTSECAHTDAITCGHAGWLTCLDCGAEIPEIRYDPIIAAFDAAQASGHVVDDACEALDHLIEENARLREALAHIEECSQHPSLTVRTVGYLGRAAHLALNPAAPPSSTP